MHAEATKHVLLGRKSLGCPAAISCSGLAELLYGVKVYDVPTLVLVSSLLMGVTFGASYVPARHATKIRCGHFDRSSLQLNGNSVS
jgi:hypothetical protein